MNIKKILTFGIIASLCLFILAAILFNDISLDLVGIGIVILGVVIMICINYKK